MKRWALLAASLIASGAAAEYPERPVRIVVPYVAGAMGDVLSRLLAEEIRPKLGQPVLVDNRPGAGGNIGTGAVASASADGYTVLIGATNNFVINQFLYGGMGFDPLAKLAPVTILVDVPSVIFIPSQVPAKSFAEFVQWARANRGRVNYGSPGAGTTPHLSAALISKTRDLGMTHIPYKGASQGVSALLANEVQFYMGGAGLGAQHVKAGKLHALAVSNDQRLPALPDTPTFKEAGLADIKAANYWALAVPKATPPEAVQRLYREFRDALRSPAAQERFAKLGVVPLGTSPAETAQRWQHEAAYWGKAVKEMAIRID